MRMLNILSSMLLIVISVIYLTFGRFNGSQEVVLIFMIAVAIAFGFLLAKYLLDDHLYFGRTVAKIRQKTKWSFLTEKRWILVMKSMLLRLIIIKITN